MKLSSLVAFFFGLLLAIPIGAKAIEEKPLPFEKEVAIVIFDAQSGTDLAKSELPKLYQETFEKKGFIVVMGEPVEKAAKKLAIKLDAETLPHDLVLLGRELGAKNVIPVQAKVSTKYVWVNLLPRARSMVAIETMILTTTDDLPMINIETINQSSYVKDGGYHQEALTLTLAWPAALLTGGSLSSAERKAITNAIEQTYGRFFDIQITWGKIFSASH